MNRPNENANSLPEWKGDLDDDCTAHWAGFVLRAEWMNDDDWWWCVYDEGSIEQIAASHGRGRFPTGESARAAALEAAREILALRRAGKE